MDYGNEVVIVINNVYKLEEIGEILKDFEYKVYFLKDVDLVGIEIVEDGKIFEYNVLIKVRIIVKKIKFIVILDDFGLEVDVLGKKFGVYLVRYVGEYVIDEENRKKLLKVM